MDNRSPQEQARSAVEYLLDTAAEVAAAKADVVRAESMLKHTKALVMKSSEASAISAQERDAYASEEYVQAIDEVFKATHDYEILKARREAAQARIEYWRTLSANQRGAERGFGSAA